MSLLNLSVKHGKTYEEARTLLETAVADAQVRFGPMIQRVEWTPDHSGVKMLGAGVIVDLRVDPQDVHAVCDVPLLASFVAAPLTAELKRIVQKTFHKELT